MIEMNKETEEKSPAERIASFLDQMEPMFPNPQAAAELRRLQEANTMLHQALARAEQDWSLLKATQESLCEHMARIKELEAQPAWVNLTDDEIDELFQSPMSLEPSGSLGWVRCIEAALKEKNHD